MPHISRRPLRLGLAFAILLSGLAVRMAPLGLPVSLVKYGGSALWAATIYWLVATAFPRASTVRLAVIAALIAAAIEFFKLVQTPALDAFRLTLAGKLLLGRVFSFWDIAVYWLAIAASANIDKSRKHQQR